MCTYLRLNVQRMDVALQCEYCKQDTRSFSMQANAIFLYILLLWHHTGFSGRAHFDVSPGNDEVNMMRTVEDNHSPMANGRDVSLVLSEITEVYILASLFGASS